MKPAYIIIALLCSGLPSAAQQDPLYSQYFNNPMLINPAFAGSMERLYAGVAYRTQWAGIDGGPVTFNFNTHMTLVNNKVGVGLLAVQDKLGDVKNTQAGGVASYRIKLSGGTTFSFGMQMGFTRYATDPNAVRLQNNPDPAFNQIIQSQFNLGAGALLQNQKYLVSLSVPRMLPGSVSQGGQTIKIYSQNFYLYGAYYFALNDNVQFRPSTLLRATPGTPASIDVNCNFTFKRLYTAGIFTRKFNTYGVLLQMVFSNYRIGYVFELPGKGSALNYNTHEISVAISLPTMVYHSSSTGL